MSPSRNPSSDYRRTVAQVNESPDEILSDLARLFAGFDLSLGDERVSARGETQNEELECMPGTLPKCKNYDIFSEIAGASYFIVNGFIYGWDKIGWSIFAVNESCEPLEPFIFCGTSHNQDIVIMDAVFRIDEKDTLFRGVGSGQWIPELLYHAYGDARATLLAPTALHGSFPPPEEQTLLPTNPARDEFIYAGSRPPFVGQTQSNVPRILQPCKDKKVGSNDLSGTGLLGSLQGFGLGFDSSPDLSTIVEIASFNEPNLGLEPAKDPLWGEGLEINPLSNVCDVNGADLSTPFLGEGQSPSLDSITKWIEFQKSARVPGSNWICPLVGCGRVLRRPHALKDHLLFHYDIKTFKCPYFSCNRIFATKCNCDRHMKNCKFQAAGSGAQ
ncbi:unnamed protein product [Rhizoctonia solani]|uniref:C2H2-type domain-containing protein n=1 Tax=Rhizoctonia solani TaxID=456999 RepID=A0A8H2XRQ4_9AGAM|nr:unnamed protein product [Rhizoctonia solani]